MSRPELSPIAERVAAGDIRAGARLMRDLDDRRPGAVEALRELYPRTGRALIVGVTGNPGAGKSTVVDGLIDRYRKQGKTVGVVAVDPTSPFSGGAILGDRIRMQRHATDDGVFIRSMATRGHLGGLSRSTMDVVAVLDAMGFDIVIIETVGVGQDEIDIVSSAQTAVVVTVPGLGDDIQAIKAGILEIADVLVVNKADREGADRTIRDLTHMLDLRGGHGARGRKIEILRTIATTGAGLDDLIAAIERHGQAVAEKSAERARARAAVQIAELVKDGLGEEARRIIADQGGLDALAAEVAERRRDPYGIAQEIVRTVLGRP